MEKCGSNWRRFATRSGVAGSRRLWRRLDISRSLFADRSEGLNRGESLKLKGRLAAEVLVLNTSSIDFLLVKSTLLPGMAYGRSMAMSSKPDFGPASLRPAFLFSGRFPVSLGLHLGTLSSVVCDRGC